MKNDLDEATPGGNDLFSTAHMEVLSALSSWHSATEKMFEITKNTYPIKLRYKRQFGIYHEGLLFERVL